MYNGYSFLKFFWCCVRKTNLTSIPLPVPKHKEAASKTKRLYFRAFFFTCCSVKKTCFCGFIYLGRQLNFAANESFTNTSEWDKILPFPFAVVVHAVSLHLCKCHGLNSRHTKYSPQQCSVFLLT